MTEPSERDLFLAALDLPEGSSAEEFLCAQCPEDAALRQRVLELLALSEQTTDWLPETPTLWEKEGDIIGRYRLLRVLGEGGFGTVWLAEQHEPVRREVALKILKIGLDTRAVIERFHAERQALAMMVHPCVARIFDAGATAAGRPYYVMDRLDGVPLREWLGRKPPVRARVGLLRDVCRAVHHVHGKGIIHRDLKPSNIIVIKEAGQPEPRLIDFGIARILSPEGLSLTAPGWVWGTPDYMSPEQRAGMPADTASDIYALGLILRESSHASGGEAHSDSTRGRELGWIAATASDPSPARRYASAAALADDLQRWLDGIPVSAAPPSARYRLSRLAARQKAMTAAILMASAGLLTGLIMALAGRAAAEKGRLEAEAGRAAARKEQIRAETALGIMQRAFATGYAGINGKWDYTVNQLVEDLATHPPEEALADPAVEWSLRHSLACALEGRGRHDLALASAQRLVTLAEMLGDEKRLAESHSYVGDSLVVMDRHADAAPHYRHTVEYFAAQGQQDSIAWILNTIGVGKCQLATDRPEEALATAQSVIAAVEKSTLPAGEKDSLLARAWGLCGDVHRRRGNDGAWMAAAEKRLAVISRGTPPDDSQVLSARHYFARALSRCGQPARALLIAREVLESRRRVFGPGTEPVQESERLVKDLESKQ